MTSPTTEIGPEARRELSRSGDAGASWPPLVLPFAQLDRTALAVAGGKAANLGELVRAGLPVPPGFCITTHAYALATASADLGPVLDALAATPAEDTARRAELAAEARAAILAAPIPDAVAAAVRRAYAALGEVGEAVPVAVRCG